MLDAGQLWSRWREPGPACPCRVLPDNISRRQGIDSRRVEARASAAPIGDRPHLCVQVAERQLASATKLYQTEENEKARAALADVIAFSEQAATLPFKRANIKSKARLASAAWFGSWLT